MEITERDIKRVEKIFFKGNSTFEDEHGERYSFISCIDRSIDVEACPGSGKTTSLLAKLYLLSEKISSGNGGGICVLTHTNVAINEIKRQLGNKADRLFRYPNFFGTIQSFVDRFLAIPACSKYFGIRPKRINGDEYDRRSIQMYQNISWQTEQDLKKWIYGSANRGQSDLSTAEKNNNAEEFFKNLKVNYDNGIITDGFPNGRTVLSGNSRSEESRKKFNKIVELKNQIIREGVLGYDEAFLISLKYIQDHQKELSTVFSKRFGYVFIDEMQDTYAHQDTIIKAIFDDNAIVQRIGDPNQAILNDNNSNSAWEDSERLKITGSRRCSQAIANILKTVALNGDSGLTGYGDATIPPHIIPYQKGNESEVLEKFVSLIFDFGLDNENINKYPIKAVGWVGKAKQGLTINSYFGAYSKALAKKKSLNNLKSAILLCDTANPKELQNAIIDCCLEVLRLAGIKNATPKGQRFYTKTSFLEQLRKKHFETLIALNTNIANWGLQIGSKNADEIVSALRDFLINDFFLTLDFTLNDRSIDFIKNDEVVEANEEQLEAKNVFCSHLAHLCHIPVEIGTVHSVKGETHKATLYMETAYHGKTCGEYLIEQLCGVPYTPPKKRSKYKESCLKIAHVGMSRPTHLLCLALNKELVEENKERLKNKGWKVY